MRARPSRLVLLGHPVSHSLSPVFQNAALASAGIPISYVALDVRPADLQAVMLSLVAQNAAGNVTVPHKAAALRLCRRVTVLAERVGAVNTFWVDDPGCLVGDNTDVEGFAALAATVLPEIPGRARVALLGAGGAAAAALAALERWPDCEVRVFNRTSARARDLARRFSALARPVPSAAAAVRGASVVVNATAIGMRDDQLPVPIAVLEPGAAVLDLVYRRGGTAWVRSALAAGHPASAGLTMLLEQGALSFERWLGIPAPRQVMRAAVG